MLNDPLKTVLADVSGTPSASNWPRVDSKEGSLYLNSLTDSITGNPGTRDFKVQRSITKAGRERISIRSDRDSYNDFGLVSNSLNLVLDQAADGSYDLPLDSVRRFFGTLLDIESGETLTNFERIVAGEG